MLMPNRLRKSSFLLMQEYRERVVGTSRRRFCRRVPFQYLSATPAILNLTDSCANRIRRGLSSASENRMQEERPSNAQLHLDFFGEPVTFLGPSDSANTINNAMAALDGFLLAVVSKGKSCTDGGEEAGLAVQASHSSALSWSEALKFSSVWNRGDRAVPMLAVVTVAPVLAQAGSAYVKHLDVLLKHTKPAAPGMPPIQLFEAASHSVLHKDNSLLNVRERKHLEALDYLLKDQHATALVKYLQILRLCPGDALALSLAMDVAQTCGDKDAALRASGSVAAYWNERRGGFIRPAIPGLAMASSLMALGLAVGGHYEAAEPMAARAMKQGRKVAGGLATWAQTHVFDAGGRVSEGISALANGDGIANYEGSGLLYFDCRLGGYGARFSLDREERGRGRSKALRLYDDNFGRVLEATGFAEGYAESRPYKRAPLGWADSKLIAETEAASKESSFFQQWIFGHPKEKDDEKQVEVLAKENAAPARKFDGWEPACEDVLTWLPPTPQVLSDATLLLFRCTLNGTISRKNDRWESIKKAWEALLTVQRQHKGSLQFAPLASITASILFPPSETGGDRIGSGRLAQGLNRLGEELGLGRLSIDPQTETTGAVREVLADREPDFWLPASRVRKDFWATVVDDILSAIDGIDILHVGELADENLRFKHWDFEARPLLEHALVFAACKSGDVDKLAVARSMCSQGVTLRPNSPEEWWRYSIVLGLLGDDVASEEALNNSINVGAGQGARSS